MVDATEGVLGIEWIEGKSVRKLLPGESEGDEEGEEESDEEKLDALKEYEVSIGMPWTCMYTLRGHRLIFRIDQVMTLIGTEIAKMHLADVIHGDLTTSNMILRHPSSFQSTTEVPTELVGCLLFASIP